MSADQNNDSSYQYDRSNQGTYGEFSAGGNGGGGKNSYSYNKESEQDPQRSIKDYVFILRERIWYIILIFIIATTGAVFYTLSKVPVFQAASTIQILRDDPNALKTFDSQRNEVNNAEDFNTQVGRLRSTALIRSVKERMTREQKERLMAPYEDVRLLRGKWTEEEVLIENLSVQPQRATLLVSIIFSHPDRELTADLANMFANQYIEENRNSLTRSSLTAAGGLESEGRQQEATLKEIETKLANYRQKYDSISLDHGENIDRDELLRLNNILTDKKDAFDDAFNRWKLVQEYRDAGKDTWDISFIADQGRLSRLLADRAAQRVEVQALAKRYKSKHPTMIRAVNSLQQVEAELKSAVTSAESVIEAGYLTAERSYKNAELRLEDKKKEMYKLEDIRLDYIQLLRQRDNIETHLSLIETRKNEELTSAQLRKPNANIVEDAVAPIYPSGPNHVLNVAAGVCAGMVLGVAVALMMGLIDDRVKTAFDIECFIGMSIAGIIPRVSRLLPTERSKMVATGADPRITEAFRSIYSSLKLSDVGKNAKCIATTSTIPGEGKSFVSTNLALTFASHGEKTLLIDADLRMPNVAKSLELESGYGLISFFEKEVPIDKIISTEVFPNLDVITSGGKTKSATQILGSREFAEMLEYFRQHYDRIVIDNPPLGAVSDCLNVLPLVDGLFYVMRYNTVRKRAVRVNMHKATQSNTPILGAILNNISTSMASYYYSSGYDKTYSDYYLAEDELDEEAEEDKAALTSSAGK